MQEIVEEQKIDIEATKEVKKSHINDVDLDFLKEVANNDLNPLVDIIVGKEFNERWTERLTKHSLYKQHFPNHREYVEVIIDEIQRFGGNTIVNVFRRKGVAYREILCNICERMQIECSTRGVPTEDVEKHFLVGVLLKCLPNMSVVELEEIMQHLGLQLDCSKEEWELSCNLEKVLLQSFKEDQFAYKIAQYMVIQQNKYIQEKLEEVICRKDLQDLQDKLLGNKEMSDNSSDGCGEGKQILGFLSGGIKKLVMGDDEVYMHGAKVAVTAATTIALVPTPAYRVTIPAVFYIAFLRLKYKLLD